MKVVSMNGQEEEPVNAKVKSLIVYPVKSFRGVTLKKAIITERGLAVPNLNDNLSIDRLWCVCDLDGYVQDIRTQQHFATIAVDIDYKSNSLILSPTLRDDLKDFGSLIVPIDETAYKQNPVQLVSDRYKNYWFGQPLNGYKCGVEASSWITSFIHKHNRFSRGMEFMFVRFKSDSNRRMSKMFKGKSDIAKRAILNDQAAFADCAPFHLISSESISDLSNRLPPNASCEKPVSIFRFRPNIEVKGLDKPYAEDTWITFSIGGAHFRQLGPTGRCIIPTTCPKEGIRCQDEEPRATLMKYRPLPYGDGPHGGPILGIWAAPQPQVEHVVSVGDEIIRHWSDMTRL